ncbi:hypothetical protein CDL15_Pgr006834 [Punica granatum]|uniref:F-box domain-containing protein n=1 Tax=Punica granatum TaxID=22663 RepID=A0A218X770_PUNGR|nr:hypothetical protein CDL15_Pgr006834 [Punica granatum]
MEKAVDRISDLPTHLMDQILVRLPIKEAVRTSILSTKWRYKWASIPELVFHNDLECHPIDGRRLVDIVDHVLRSHVGPTVKFEACHEDVYDSRTINRWILRLSRMHIGEFVFYNIHWKGHRLSTRLFALRDLVHLQLSWCIIKLPVRFTDFGSPKEILTAFCLLRSCPNLEEVEFKEEYGSRKPFEQVKFLPFSNTGGLEAEIGLMKFLLVNSPGLKRIKVQVSYYERVREVYLEKLVELPRASPQVRIIYEHDSLKFDQEFDDEILPEVA